MMILRWPLPCLPILLALMPHASCADLAFDSVGAGYADAVIKFNGMKQTDVHLSWRHSDPRSHFLLPDSWDLTIGQWERNGDGSIAILFGPTLRFQLSDTALGPWFVDIGSHLTYLREPVFDGRDMGSRFHLTSRLGVGAFLGHNNRTSIILDYRHTSNADLVSVNPGVDMVGLAINYHFGGNQKR